MLGDELALVTLQMRTIENYYSKTILSSPMDMAPECLRVPVKIWTIGGSPARVGGSDDGPGVPQNVRRSPCAVVAAGVVPRTGGG